MKVATMSSDTKAMVTALQLLTEATEICELAADVATNAAAIARLAESTRDLSIEMELTARNAIVGVREKREDEWTYSTDDLKVQAIEAAMKLECATCYADLNAPDESIFNVNDRLLCKRCFGNGH